MKIPAYKRWIKSQRCSLLGVGYVDPHHCGDFGTAKTNHDEWLVPLARLLHTSKTSSANKEYFRILAPKYFRKWFDTLTEKKQNKLLENSDVYAIMKVKCK